MPCLRDTLMVFHTGNLTDVQIRTGVDKVARVKRVAEEINVHKIRNDLRRE